MWFATSAHAQPPDPAADAVVKAGPLAFTPSLSVPFIGVDSNIFNEAESPLKDFVVNVQPAVDAWLRFAKAQLNVRQQFNLVRFNRYTSESALNSVTNVEARLALIWGTPYANLAVMRIKDRADARIDTRATIRTMPASAGIDFRLGDTMNLEAEAGVTRVRFDRESAFEGTQLSSALDRDSHLYQATLRYAVTPPTTLSIRVARNEERFQFSDQRNSTGIRVVPGVAFARDAFVTGGLRLGWLAFRPVSANARPADVLVGDGDLGFVLLGVTRFRLVVNRDVVPSLDGDTRYALQSSTTGTITHRVSDGWDVTVGATGLRLDFGRVRPPNDPDTTVARVDVMRTYTAGIGLYFSRGLRVGLRAESMKRQSALPLGNFNNVRFVGSISYVRQ